LCDVTLQVNGHERTPILGKLDEAWQCTYADLGALGALARQVVCVGDPGQVAPVVTGSTERWEGQASGPHQPAPAALLAAHGEAITVHELTNSWRLGPQTCALVSQHFYPQMPFTSRRPDEAVIAPDGTVLPEIISRPTEARNGPTDPALLTALAEWVRELTGHDYRRGGRCEALTAQDIAVVCPTSPKPVRCGRCWPTFPMCWSAPSTRCKAWSGPPWSPCTRWPGIAAPNRSRSTRAACASP